MPYLFNHTKLLTYAGPINNLIIPTKSSDRVHTQLTLEETYTWWYIQDGDVLKDLTKNVYGNLSTRRNGV